MIQKQQYLYNHVLEHGDEGKTKALKEILFNERDSGKAVVVQLRKQANKNLKFIFWKGQKYRGTHKL